MQIDQHSQNAAIILRPHGTMDSLVYTQFMSMINQINDPNCETVLIDLIDVYLVDSIMLSGFTQSFRRLNAKGISMALANPQPYVLELLNLVKIQRVVPVYASLDEALCAGHCSAPSPINQEPSQA